MLQINTFFVEVSGTILNSRLTELFGPDVEDRMCTKRHALSHKPIDTYRLNRKEMKKLEASRVSEGFKFIAYREIRTSGNIIEIEGLSQLLNASEQSSMDAVIRRTKTQLKTVMDRRKKKPLVTA